MPDKILKHILIIGGTSGLGLKLAQHYQEQGHTVFIGGRKNPQLEGVQYIPFSMGADGKELANSIDTLISTIPKVNTLIYVAGFYQEGRIDALTDQQIFEMINVGLAAPAILIQRLKNNPGNPLKIMLVTSSSQYTPRDQEPIYTAVKAGLGMLGDSLSLDTAIGKVLVVAPSGMKTPFWSNTDKDTSEMLDPQWVAGEIVKLSSGPFKYRYAKVLRGPARVEIVETRP